MIAPIEPPFIASVLPEWFVSEVSRLVGGRDRVANWMQERLETTCSGDESAHAWLIQPNELGTLRELGGDALGYRTPWTHDFSAWACRWAHLVWPLAGWAGCELRLFEHRFVAIGEQLPATTHINNRPVAVGTVLTADATRHIRRDGRLLVFRAEFVLREETLSPRRFWNRTVAFEDQLQAFAMTQEPSWNSQRGKREARALQRAFDFGAEFNRKGPYA